MRLPYHKTPYGAAAHSENHFCNILDRLQYISEKKFYGYCRSDRQVAPLSIHNPTDGGSCTALTVLPA